MSALKKHILLIGPWKSVPSDLEFLVVSRLKEADFAFKKNSFDVIALPITLVLEKKFLDFHKEISTLFPHCQWILVAPQGFSPDQLIEIQQNYSFFKILDSYTDPALNQHLLSALERSQAFQQNLDLQKLFQDLNQKLERVQFELEERVEKRTRNLTEARHRLMITNQRIEALKHTLLGVYKAISLNEIERNLNNSLNSLLNCSWIKVVLSPQDSSFVTEAETLQNFSFLQVPLNYDNKHIGSVFFMRAPSQIFTKDENDYLNRISEAVSLSVARIQRFKDLVDLKNQWETAFNAFTSPIALINAKYELLQGNSAAQTMANQSLTTHKKCYELLFKRKQPCPGCQLGQDFQIQDKKLSTFEITSQKIALEQTNEPVFVNIYFDATKKIKLQAQLLESVKMAQLGTIGSSIAHELNNPIGGILTFAQLLKADLSKDDPLYPDIEEIEKGALRCRDIIQNLLGYSRIQVSSVKEAVLSDILDRAIKIIELKARPLGISIESTHQSHQERIAISPPRAEQVLIFFLQKSVDSLLEAGKKLSPIQKKIYLNIESEGKFHHLIIKNIGALNKQMQNFSLPGLQMQTQILADMGGQWEISSASSPEPWVKISLPAL